MTRLTVSQFTNDQNKTPAEILEDKQMLIIGFDDVYENIPENGVEAIDEFIKAGKSVIFHMIQHPYIIIITIKIIIR